ncbi:MAG: ABC transporter ATP-binding protein [Collinsella intestinalis]|uniref:ABC transporter ATP-binding protein n=1 Tax=Collinsella intestinalis TaxID=147207 RepID=A0A943BNN8_9ACTN|nr:ABC transporter ATP-binding protein [Collinsella intestinalis]
MFKRFISYYGPEKGLFIADTVCALTYAGIDLAFPIILRALTGGLFTEGAAAIMDGLLFLGLGLVGLYIVRTACIYFVSAQGHIMGARMESRMREDLFDQYERFSFAYFDAHNSGDMMSRVVNDLFDICEGAHHLPEWIIICGIKIIGALAILFTISPELAGALTLVTVVFVGLMVRQNLHMRSVFADNRTKISEVNSQLQDSLAGMRVVKSFANEETERAKFRVANGRYLDSKVAQYKVMGSYQATSAVMTAMHYITIVLFGGYLVAQGQMTAVDMATFALYISYKPGARVLEVTEGAIEYRDVCFSYEQGEAAEAGAEVHPVIDHMNLSIKPGETIALVGPSGGGKSTTCALLPRFYDVASGSITIDGQDVRDVTQHSLRSAIGLVQQDVYLFDGTLRDNIAYGRPGATNAEIEDAARKANIHDFIASLPEGYDTVVGERGSRLSGGQKQRVAIARVFLKDPAILILDEATSALDNESEEAVQESLERLAADRTTIIIAHRLSTIKNADEIATVERGRVVERGTHEELLARGGTYARYYRMQFEGARARDVR